MPSPSATNSPSHNNADSFVLRLEDSPNHPQAQAISGLQAEYLTHIGRPQIGGAGPHQWGSAESSGTSVQRALSNAAQFNMPSDSDAYKMHAALANDPRFVEVKRSQK